MAWRNLYLDLILVPLALVSSLLYHCWLCYMVRTHPYRTTMGVNFRNQRAWVAAMLKDNDKKNILAIQTLRNYIMGSSLVATTTVLICCSTFAFDSRAVFGTRYNHGGATFGSRDEPEDSYKFAVLLLAFLTVFSCQCLSIGYLNQVGILINIINMEDVDSVKPEYVSQLLEKGLLLSTIGNRMLYATLPLILWIFGPVPVFVCSMATIPALYNLDIINVHDNEGNKGVGNLCWKFKPNP